MWWYGMIMHDNVWYGLIFNGCVGRLRLSRILRHAWWMYQNDSYSWDVQVTQNWFTCDGSPNMTHAPITPINSYDDTPILLYLEESYKHCECMRVHENDWEWLRMSHIHGGVWVIPCLITFYDMHENALALHQSISYWMNRSEWMWNAPCNLLRWSIKRILEGNSLTHSTNIIH